MVAAPGAIVFDPVATPVVMTYLVDLPAGNYRIWTRHAATSPANDSLYVQLGDSPIVQRGLNESATGEWRWIASLNVATSISGVQEFRVYRREGGVPVDRFVITLESGGNSPSGK